LIRRRHQRGSERVSEGGVGEEIVASIRGQGNFLVFMSHESGVRPTGRKEQGKRSRKGWRFSYSEK